MAEIEKYRMDMNKKGRSLNFEELLEYISKIRNTRKKFNDFIKFEFLSSLKFEFLTIF